MASKLDPFKHLFGTVPEDKLADMAGVQLATVAAFRRAHGLPVLGDESEAADPEPVPEPAAEPEVAGADVPRGAVTASPADPLVSAEPVPSPTPERAPLGERGDVQEVLKAAAALKFEDKVSIAAAGALIENHALTLPDVVLSLAMRGLEACARDIMAKERVARRRAGERDAAAETRDADSPRVVRVRRPAVVQGAPNRPGRWSLRRRDVIRGEDAAWLWQNHRELVEPFPPRHLRE